MDNLLWIFVSALLVNNFVLAYFLGLCPFLGVSNSLETSARLGLATTFVMLVTGRRKAQPSEVQRHVAPPPECLLRGSWQVTPQGRYNALSVWE